MIVMWRGIDGHTDGSRHKFIPDILKFFNEHPRLSNTLKFCCCQLMSNPVKNEGKKVMALALRYINIYRNCFSVISKTIYFIAIG